MQSDRVHLSTTNVSQVGKIHCCSKKWALLLFAVASFMSRAWPSGGRQPAPQLCEQPRSFRALHAQGTQTAATGIASSLRSRRSSQLPCWTDWSASQSERRKVKIPFLTFSSLSVLCRTFFGVRNSGDQRSQLSQHLFSFWFRTGIWICLSNRKPLGENSFWILSLHLKSSSKRGKEIML